MSETNSIQRLVNPRQASEIGEILRGHANEVAVYETAHVSGRREEVPRQVRLALQREIERLRRLADAIDPPEVETD